jgi:hypothetical protein
MKENNMELFKPTINDYGGSPIAEHDMPCPICTNGYAVYNLSENLPKSGVFDPCSECEQKGWFISRVQPNDFIGRFLRKWFV